MKDSDQDACGYAGGGLGWYCWHLRGLQDAEDPASGVQLPAACLESLEAPGRQALQGYELFHGLEDFVEYQKPMVEASNEAPGPVYGTIQGFKAIGTNYLQVGCLPQCYLEGDTPSFTYQHPWGLQEHWIEVAAASS